MELRVAKRTNEDYVPTPVTASARVFAGQGQRLGAPVPSAVASNPAASNMPGAFPSGTGAQPPQEDNLRQNRGSVTTMFEVDHSQPTTTVQLRLADGSRVVWRANLTHTIGDLRGFVNACVHEYYNV